MNRVFRCYVEKKPEFQVEADALARELRESLGILSIDTLRIFNRYDVQGISRSDYIEARTAVFSEPQCDDCHDEAMPEFDASYVLAVAPLPGQYDQRSDSCAQCIQIMTQADKPLVAAAKVYAFFCKLSAEDIEKIDNYLINPVESIKAASEKPETLEQRYPEPEPVKTVTGFISYSDEQLREFLSDYGLAMDLNDLIFMQNHFRNEERRDPTVTEIRLIDTYWSDHCRHTTFHTHLKNIKIHDKAVAEAFEQYLRADEEVYGDEAALRPVTLMNIATMAMKTLKSRGLLDRLDESEEVNACSVRVEADTGGGKQDWLLMFKNETHNHPTEIEPYGGAATCLGGAIRDPLSGRSYVYQSMRITGSADPTVPVGQALEGKLPQRKITTTAAAGFSSYGNQIGLATGLVQEIYHPGYMAKRMEVGAVIGATPANNVVRERPRKGDLIILLGGRTGRDGCGGATGSSKSHSLSSLEACASEVQKGNPPEERKIQRLFRKPEVTRMIKRCNDFGAGGVSVAVGELADSLDINLDSVLKKYDGLDGTELAISESQERMAVVVEAGDAEDFIRQAGIENLEATVIAEVTDTGRMVMRHGGRVIADLSREFLNSNGAVKTAGIYVPELPKYVSYQDNGTASQRLRALLSRITVCSQRGLGQRFDGSIGAGSVLMPYGGKYQLTPAQVMAALIPAKASQTCSVMSHGLNPFLSECCPFEGAAAAVVESLSKLVASGCAPENAYLSLQEYFEKLRDEPHRWGKPFSSVLGAFTAQMGLGVAAIGGKDSMSGSFLSLDVPPTLISFAVATARADDLVTPEFKTPGNPVYLFTNPDIMNFETTKMTWAHYNTLCREGKILSGWALTLGGIAEGVFKMSIGNKIGFQISESFFTERLFCQEYGGIIAECSEDIPGAILIGYTTERQTIDLGDGEVYIDEYIKSWEAPLENVFPTRAEAKGSPQRITYDKRGGIAPKIKCQKPTAVIPVFPGTNCEYDTAAALERAGGTSEIIVIRNQSVTDLEQSVQAVKAAIERCQMIVLPGGFSGGDEPDGSGKFIAAFFRSPAITDAVHELLYSRDGLMLGICNGFQALVKLGLLPFGRIRPMDDACPTLTYNKIGRHQSLYVTTRVSSVLSPWLSMCEAGELHTIPVSHGEGRFVASGAVLRSMTEAGQIATQYTDFDGNPTMDVTFNPNGSVCAIEGITSPDGRIFGKMGHTERSGPYVAKNIYGNKRQPIFEGGVAYFR